MRYLTGDRRIWGLAAALTLVFVVAALYQRSQPETYPGAELGQSVEDALHHELAPMTPARGLEVTCPDAPMEAGKIVDCSLSGYPANLGAYESVRVTMDDDRGHFTWQVG